MIRFGTSYYLEYMPDPRLDRDLDLMAEAGINTIRVGESVWSTWEPRDGEFHLDWMTPVLDGAHERGIGVLLGTPTYAIPPWLQRKHPELAIVRPGGGRIPWGARQEADFTSPLFLHYAERVIRTVIRRHGGHPAVIGVQLDNEPGLHLMHNETVFERFTDWLAKRYDDVDRLNEEWGLTYWSHRIGDWAELWRPEGNTTPSYDLAWRRFQAELTTEFIGWQAEIVRELVPADRVLTTCLAYQRPALHDMELSRHLTITSGNAYYLTQDALTADEPGEHTWYTSSPTALFQSADRMYASKQGRFWVTETNATSIAGPGLNLPPYDGQLRQAAWALIARGAEMVSYWHWHTLHFGAETYWGGILGHSLEPGRVYKEIATLGAELETAGDDVSGLVPDAEVGFLYSHDSKWALGFQPPFDDAYESVVAALYRGAADAGLQARFLSEPDPALPVLVAPALYCLTPELAEALKAYVEGGGHLVLTFLSGYADAEARARAEVAPGPLRELAGVRYLEYSTLLRPVPLRGGGQATRWADGLETDDAEPLDWYDHPHFGRWPAITRNGTVTYVGTLPDRDTLRQLFREIAQPRLASDDPRVTLRSAVNRRGERLWFAHNWSDRETAVTLAAPGIEVTGSREPVAAGPLRLGPCDVRVIRA
ncbi:beta-galactosidase [Nonomuraea sp. NBC_00507]|uniref:beta-galactosidase n=1 Tax=Nonomuraea sp. NBC_00507 TaxID=2976002 RepID=UPI002E16C526